jgi:hypothetical protein
VGGPYIFLFTVPGPVSLGEQQGAGSTRSCEPIGDFIFLNSSLADLSLLSFLRPAVKKKFRQACPLLPTKDAFAVAYVDHQRTGARAPFSSSSARSFRLGISLRPARSLVCCLLSVDLGNRPSRTSFA